MSISALRRKVQAKEEKLILNEQEGSIVAISTLTKRMKMLYSYEPIELYKGFRTCQIENGLFQLSRDSCQVLVPDLTARKFTIEKRRPLPYVENWRMATMVALPNFKVMVFGIKWDKNNLTPWIHDLKTNTWSNKLTPDGKDLPSLPHDIAPTTAIFHENKVFAVNEDYVAILDLEL